MKHTLNTTPKSLPQGWETDGAITMVEPLKDAPNVTRFNQPFSNVVLYRAPFTGIGRAARQMEVDRPCVYAIVQSSDEPSVHSEVYVGSTGNGETRVQQHQHDPRFGSNTHTVFVLTTTSLEANSAHMRFVEGVLNRMTADQPNTKVISQDVPPFGMSSHDQFIVKTILKDAISLLAAAGYPMNAHASLVVKNIPFLKEPKDSFEADNDAASCTSGKAQDVIWSFQASKGILRDYQLSGTTLKNGRFLLLPGSHYRADGEHILPANVVSIRNRLESEGYLEASIDGNGRLELAFPFEFASRKQAVHAMLKANKPVEGYWSQSAIAGPSSAVCK